MKPVTSKSVMTRPPLTKKALVKPQPWMPEKIKLDKANPPGTMKRAYKARPAL